MQAAYIAFFSLFFNVYLSFMKNVVKVPDDFATDGPAALEGNLHLAKAFYGSSLASDEPVPMLAGRAGAGLGDHTHTRAQVSDDR